MRKTHFVFCNAGISMIGWVQQKEATMRTEKSPAPKFLKFGPEECKRRIEEYRGMAAIMQKAGNLTAYEDCLDQALLLEMKITAAETGHVVFVASFTV
jgi:hypothetical protein